jgi:GntR family transcriptional regulator, transcriptional repressor for pyruvate dehydrogenase complex
MTSDRAQSKSLVEQVFQELATAIVSGSYKAGEHLPAERALAEQLEVNRQVVREAIRRLAQLGLVQVLHGDGTRVLDFREHGGLDVLALLMEQAHTPKTSLAFWLPILELRAALAPDVVRHCTLRAKLSLRRQILLTAQEMRRAKDDDAAIYALEARFWDLVHEGANHLVYRLTYNAFKRCARSIREQSQAWTAAEVKRSGYRIPIAEAIAAGDPERAEREVRQAMRGMLEAWVARKRVGKKPVAKRRLPAKKKASA